MAALLVHWHVFLAVWPHHHHLSTLVRWLRYEYPGMPRGWYGQYARWLVQNCGTGRDLIIAVEPY